MVLIMIFTDASVHKLGGGINKWGLAAAMYRDEGVYSHRIMLGGAGIARHVDTSKCSNPTVELLAASLVLERLYETLHKPRQYKGEVHIELYSDYIGVPMYCNGEWKLKKIDTEFRRTAFRMILACEKLRAEVDGLTVKHVKGHMGVKGNEMADSFANMATCSETIDIDETAEFVNLFNKLEL